MSSEVCVCAGELVSWCEYAICATVVSVVCYSVIVFVCSPLLCSMLTSLPSLSAVWTINQA
jgi:hypothetical protein